MCTRIRLKTVPVILAVLTVCCNAYSAGPPAMTELGSVLQLGPGDSINVHVYGQPDMDSTEYIGDDGIIRVALAGPVKVSGLSPTEASRRVEAALRAGSYLVDPHVSITVAESRSQRVSVLGEVRTPGRYAIESNATVFDVLAQAGGGTEECAEVIYVLRQEDGRVTRFPVDLNGMADGQAGSSLTLKPGDSVYVPRAERFYIYGEVQQPNMYRLEPGMTVVQAIARAGGITPRGSERGLELRRRAKDGTMAVTHVGPTDTVQADDVIRIKERLF